MTRYLLYFISALLLISCTPQDGTEVDESEWAEIEALANDEVETSTPVRSGTNTLAIVGTVGEGEFGPFFEQLEKLKVAKRAKGDTLLRGKALTFDYDQRYIVLRDGVVIEDDEGMLETDKLTGRFSASNEVEFIEAEGNVTLSGSNRTAQAEHAIYNHRSGFVQLEGKAIASLDGNRLSGERIRLWVRDDRRMICEPNALLEVRSAEGLAFEGLSGVSNSVTEIRADKAVYDESEGMAELVGNVRVRDSRAAMNCSSIRLFLKDNNEIDWIEAIGGVIIQTQEERALAERATYHADEGKFTLEGEPKIKQGPNVMTGDRIIFWHEDRRMLCEPNARVLFYLAEEDKAKFLKDLDE